MSKSARYAQARGFVTEFKDFISRGNVIDMAVGIVVGAAFTAIVNSLVDNIIMPLIGIIMGGIDFTGLSVVIGSATIAYGNFIQAVINFLLISLVVFVLIKVINGIHERAKRDEVVVVDEPATPTHDELTLDMLTQIRDELKSMKTN